jgi:lipopolysaccharide transport system ATP-binding protein
MTYRIEARTLSKVYGEGEAAHRVLDRVSFAIGEGERVGVIGANAAGKSTLLGILAGIVAPSEGEVEVVGAVHAALTVGFGMREDLTGRENLYVDAEMRGVSRREAAPAVEKMIAFCELGAFIDRPMRTYSTGMKSRLSFASLVFVNPEILLIDETLSVGDRWFARKATRAIEDLCRRGHIVILVSHSLGSIVSMCSRCLWLDRGRLVEDGDPSRVTEAYRRQISASEEAMAIGDLGGEDSVWYADKAFRVDHLELRDAASGAPRRVFDTDAGLRVAAKLCIEKRLAHPEFRLFIERADGLRVGESRTPAHLGARAATVEATLAPLALRPGIYRLDLEVLSQGSPIARRSQVFKVTAGAEMIGGSPALRLPFYARARQLTGVDA